MDGQIPICSKCKQERVLRLQSHTEKNPGRYFYKCDECQSFLCWEDEAARSSKLRWRDPDAAPAGGGAPAGPAASPQQGWTAGNPQQFQQGYGSPPMQGQGRGGGAGQAWAPGGPSSPAPVTAHYGPVYGGGSQMQASPLSGSKRPAEGQQEFGTPTRARRTAAEAAGAADLPFGAGGPSSGQVASPMSQGTPGGGRAANLLGRGILVQFRKYTDASGAERVAAKTRGFQRGWVDFTHRLDKSFTDKQYDGDAKVHHFAPGALAYVIQRAREAGFDITSDGSVDLSGAELRAAWASPIGGGGGGAQGGAQSSQQATPGTQGGGSQDADVVVTVGYAEDPDGFGHVLFTAARYHDRLMSVISSFTRDETGRKYHPGPPKRHFYNPGAQGHVIHTLKQEGFYLRCEDGSVDTSLPLYPEGQRPMGWSVVVQVGRSEGQHPETGEPLFYAQCPGPHPDYTTLIMDLDRGLTGHHQDPGDNRGLNKKDLFLLSAAPLVINTLRQYGFTVRCRDGSMDLSGYQGPGGGPGGGGGGSDWLAPGGGYQGSQGPPQQGGVNGGGGSQPGLAGGGSQPGLGGGGSQGSQGGTPGSCRQQHTLTPSGASQDQNMQTPHSHHPALSAAEHEAAVKQICASVPEELWSRLFPFQRQGVEFIVAKKGRALLADEMGLGKTVQALVAAAVFAADSWPLLIVCPPTLRFVWADALFQWLPEAWRPESRDEVVVVGSSKDIKDMEAAFGDRLPQGMPHICITTYDLVQKMKLADQYRFIICDEAHALKSKDTKRTQFMSGLVRQAPHAILITGTPLMSRPIEVWPQVDMLAEGLLGTYWEFGNKYCLSDRLATYPGQEFRGACHLEELHQLLSSHIMLRRTKAEVAQQLPQKIRQRVPVVLEGAQLSPVTVAMADLAAADQALAAQPDNQLLVNQRNAALTRAVQVVGVAKVAAGLEFVESLLEKDITLLLFAHHQEVLNGYQEALQRKKVAVGRIDGSTPDTARAAAVHKFQAGQVRVLLLSITAAGAGLTLTAAEACVFAELNWNPSSLEQAEGRAHRIGQTRCVVCYYLTAAKTTDDQMWGVLNKKLRDVGEVLDGYSGRNMDTPSRTPGAPHAAAGVPKAGGAGSLQPLALLPV